jgi:hypothetical protein
MSIVKSDIDSFSDLLVSQGFLSRYNDVISYPYFRINVGNKYDIESIASSKNISYVNISQCVDAIKSFYKLPNYMDPIIKTIEYNVNLEKDTNLKFGLKTLPGDRTSNKVGFAVYNPLTKERINSYPACAQVNIITASPIKMPEGINLTLYKKVASKGVNIYNPEDPIFTTRCNSFIDPETNYDMPIQERQMKYKKETIKCSSNCTFSSLDSSGLALCSCSGVSSNNFQVEATVSPVNLTSFSSYNFEIIKCSEQIFSNNVTKNSAFILSTTIVAAGLAFALGASFLTGNLIVNHITRIIHTDATFFDIKSMNKSSYFNFNKHAELFQNQQNLFNMDNNNLEMHSIDPVEPSGFNHGGDQLLENNGAEFNYESILFV